MPKFPFKIILILTMLISISNTINAQTTVSKTNDQWNLMVDGNPFEIKGATFGYGKEVEQYDTYFKDLQFLGVNTIRTWATNENTIQLLDVAHAHGIKVMLGIWMRHGRPGMEDDDSFDYLEDKEGMESMYNNAIQTVENYKDHPAVLTWGIGNEVYLNIATDEEKKAYSLFLEKICSKIKTIDAQHPITSVEAWTFGLDWWQKYVPSIDIYGLNSYGAGVGFLNEELTKRNIDKPYIITEFGVTGEWDIKEEVNGIKVEPTDQQKYDAISKGIPNWIQDKPSCLGVYVFHYSNGDDFGANWLLTHVNGMYRPQYWAIREAYTGQKATNAIPIIHSFVLEIDKAKSGTWISVKLDASDAEGEAIDFNFYYNQRTGSRKRRNQMVPLLSRGSIKDGFQVQLPSEDGAIKIYVYANDTFNNLGIASTTINVIDELARTKTHLVPKAILPFYVYKENEGLPYLPTGYMGNYEAIEVDLNNTEEVHAGDYSIKIGYKAKGNWYGVAFVDPANDWGDILGGYDISGAKKFSFWAKANDSSIRATVGFGLIDKDKPFPDSSKISEKIKLTTEWKHYTFKIKKLDLQCIRTGFVIFSSGNGIPHKIYLDDIVFE